MAPEELGAAVAFVLKHGAGTSKDVVAALVEKCDQLTSKLATLQKCYDMLQEGLLAPLVERDRELKQECRRLRDENAELLARIPEGQ